MEQVRQLSIERDQLKNTINEKEKENYELQSKRPFKMSTDFLNRPTSMNPIQGLVGFDHPRKSDRNSGFGITNESDGRIIIPPNSYGTPIGSLLEPIGPGIGFVDLGC